MISGQEAPEMRWLMCAVLLACAVPSSAAPKVDPRQRALREVDQLQAEIGGVCRALWDFSETALKEARSAALLADRLEKEGFQVQRGVAGMPTAFVASWGTGSPTIGILAEYDALPGVGNAPVPRKQPREDGVTSGQGCGHNLFGAGSVGAALALQRTMKAAGLPGTLKLFGTPAEETLVGKAYMARDGLFDGLDAALEWHPDDRNAVLNFPNQAMNNFTVEFFGRAAHAAADPWKGRSALHAVELLTHGANLMREHLPPTARVHYVIPSAGEAPNVIPAYAKVWLYVRDTERAAAQAHYEWLLKIAEGAALATQTTHKVTLTTGVHEYLFNRPLQEALQKNLEVVGAPAYGPEEQSFARQLQKELGLPEAGVDTTVRKLAAGVEASEGGSTDVAEVSHVAPTVGLVLATAGKDLPWHSWAASASHGLPGASRAAVTAAKVLALTGVDLLTQPRLRDAARADFDTRRGGQPYRSPLPAGQKPPLP
jgi:aminobenzoyl-glutamate utilization protein B